MPTTKVILTTFLILGWWIYPLEARGQGAAPDRTPAQVASALGADRNADAELDHAVHALKDLAEMQEKTKAVDGPEIDQLKAKVELQQKQIEVLLKMTQLLADQAKKQPDSVPELEALQEQVATHESRIQQGAQRDQELAISRDDLVQWLDAGSRQEPLLPSTLRELFLPSRTNQSPLTIYGMLSQEFDTFSQMNSTFRPPTLQLHPYLALNDAC